MVVVKPMRDLCDHAIQITDESHETVHHEQCVPETYLGILRPLQVLKSSNQNVRKFMAECFGTFILVAFGDSVVAQAVLSGGTKGDISTAMICWGIALTIGVYLSYDISGAHLNPAITLTQALIGRMKWALVPAYFTAQYLGAFLGSCLVYAAYYGLLLKWVEYLDAFTYLTGVCATAQIWATYPQPFISDGQGLIDEIVATAFLVGISLAITDNNLFQIPKHFIPPLIGCSLCAIIAAFGLNTMAALNPARDFSPRVFTALVGYGSNVFKQPTMTWWLVPILGPHIGGVVGALAYYIFIGLHVTGTAVK